MPTELTIQVQSSLLILVAGINFVFSVIIYLRSKVKSSIFFIIAIVAVGLWSLGIGIYIRPGINEFTRYLVNYNYLIASLIAVAFFFFAFYFGSEVRKLPKVRVALGILLWIAVIILTLKTDLIIGSVVEANLVKSESLGILYPLYALHILAFFGSGFLILTKKFKTSTKIFKTQLGFVILGTAIATTMGVTVNLVFLSVFSYYDLIWLGPFGTLIMVILISYAIIKHGLWDLKIAATELFISIILFLLLVDILVARNLGTRLLAVVILSFVAVSSYFLVRSIFRRMEIRKNIEIIAKNLAAANRRLREVDIEKSDFVSIASHQLRTPLSVIKGYTSMLLEGDFGEIKSDQQHAILDRVDQASTSLVRMIEEFLDIAKIDKGEMVYNKTTINIKDCLEKLISNFKKIAASEKLNIAFRFNKSEKFLISGDELKIKQVLTNIIDNSIKYTIKGGHIMILLESNKKKGKILITVKDNGIGIDSDMMPKLFEKFSRAKGMSKLHTEGRGLGLYVAKQIVKAHSGRIWAESQGKNKGTTFYIEFNDLAYEDKRKEVKRFIGDL